MGTVVSLNGVRSIENCVKQVELDVLFQIYVGNRNLRVHIPGLRIVHWKDTESNQWDTEVASLACADDKDPNIVGMVPGLLDCLVPDNDSPSYRYFLRRPFHRYMNGLVENTEEGWTHIPQGAVVIAVAERILTVNFTHGQIISQTDPVIVSVVN